MARKEQICVIGLGKFGYYLGKALIEMGHEVMGLDGDEEKVKNAQEVLSQTFRLDATDKQALDQVNAGEMSHVVVSVGHSMEASILITLYLKELGAKSVAVKAVSDDHEKLLRKIGADMVFIPERYAARQLAHKLVKPGLIEFLPMDSEAAIQEVAVDAWHGKTLRELDLTNKRRVQVIARKNVNEEAYSYIPRADDPLNTGDKLILVGREDKLNDLEP